MERQKAGNLNKWEKQNIDDKMMPKNYGDIREIKGRFGEHSRKINKV